ncbi:hypothetical protein KP733_08945 [Streptococcus equi subsp. zooepidemicus]|nr:hypothetical protein [Streptococcus equi]MCD3387511.1 hypothetical protein [Streptococcus equi subsp. zooepidemicus]
MKSYFQEKEITPLIQKAIILDEEEPVTSQQLSEFASALEDEFTGC